MTTFTIRINTSATDPGGLVLGYQDDVGTPSYWDMVVTGSSDPVIKDGVYDAWCLNPTQGISVVGSYSASAADGSTAASYVPIGFNALSQSTVDRINWVLAQNFASDPKYGGQFNKGEIQIALWKILGFTDAQINATPQAVLNDNNRTTVLRPDADFIVQASQAAVQSGVKVTPHDSYFTAIIDPAGNVQPIIVQLQFGKIGNFVWDDANRNGVQDAGEAGVDNVVVELYDGQGNLLNSTKTGDDKSTAAIEQGYYQFTGLSAGNYQVKFIAPTNFALTTQDSTDPVATDTNDSDANVLTGLSQVVTLAAGESNQTIDAGLVRPTASLGNRLWLDSDGDGQQDPTETGISGQTVTLIGGGADGVINGVGDTTQTTTTDANGEYRFDDLNVGEQYQVKFDKPTGTVFTVQDAAGDAVDSDANKTTGLTQIVTLTAGEYNDTLDAGVYVPVSIGDKVFEDKNADGKQGDTEPGIDGVTVRLYKCDAPTVVIATTTTANGGLYSFDGLPPGTYHVTFETPAGFVQTTVDVGGDDAKDSDAGAGGVTGCYTLNSGDKNTTVDAGFYKLASLGDYVWADNNNNGLQDDGAANGINGVEVILLDGNGVEKGRTTTANDTSGNPGYYLFKDLVPGEYQVQFVKPAGYAFAGQDANANGSDAVDSDADRTSGLTVKTTLESGENDLSWDAGLVKLASLGNRLWLDSDGDGQQDPTETGISGQTVTLIGGGADGVINGVGDTTQTTTTDANGEYRFDDLNVGEQYQVKFDKPTGTVFTVQDAAGDAVDSDANKTTGLTQIVTLTAGEYNDTLDAGVYVPVSIGDKVFEDKNADGKQGDTEPGIDGVTVRLYKCDAPTVVIATTTTANGGLYSFDGLPPGTYHVTFETPAGFVQTTVDVGGDDAKDSDAGAGGVTGCYTLNSGDKNTTVDAGFYKLASLGDYVWADNNNNGLQDDGAANGINGVEVILLDGNGVEKGRTTTANDTSGNPGYYLFKDLVPGEYQVQFVKPAGYAFAGQDANANGSDAVDSDADRTSGLTVKTTLESGENDLSWDAGLVKLASLGNRLWLDSDGDGQQDPTETGISGQTVTLIGGGADGVINGVGRHDADDHDGCERRVPLRRPERGRAVPGEVRQADRHGVHRAGRCWRCGGQRRQQDDGSHADRDADRWRVQRHAGRGRVRAGEHRRQGVRGQERRRQAG